MEADTGSVERVREQIPLEEANSSGAEAGEHSRSLGRIVGLFAELLSPGGVQRAGRHTAAVLATWARQHGFPYVFLSLNDPPGPHRLEVGAQEYLVSGFGRAKARFVLAALRVAGPQPALVVAAHPHLSPIVWAMKARCPRLRALVLTHGIEVWAPMSHLRRRALRHADLVLAPSAYTARHLASQQGIPEQRIHQLPWGVDPQFAVQLDAGTNHQPNHHLPPGFPAGRIVLTVGRWAASERYKGADDLIAAIARLLPVFPELYLVVVGEGDDRGRLERLAVEMGVAERVQFLAGLTQEELMACYARCDVFALPSRREGFGLVFLEAMAHGKPVVGGAHGGTPEIIEDGVTGLLVPHGDVEQLFGALEKLLTDEPLRRRMGHRARERVSESFLFEQFAGRLTQILTRLCAS